MSSTLVIDGSNLCGLPPGRTERADVRRLDAALEQFAELDRQHVGITKVFIDASLRHQVPATQQARVDALVSSGQVEQVPAGIAADNFILNYADRNDGIVVSNDLYREYQTTYPWLTAQRSGRCVAGVFDERGRRWEFMERKAGNAPARTLERILEERAASAPVASAEAAVSEGEARQRPEGRYSERVTRQKPHSIVLLLDQSGSMANTWDGTTSKSDRLADMVNRTIRELVLTATQSDGVRPYFRVAVVGYGGTGEGSVVSLLPGTTLDDPFMWVGDINSHATIVEVEAEGRRIRRPIWIEARANGNTPMYEAFVVAERAVAAAAAEYPLSFPPVVINITDGKPSGLDPREVCQRIRGWSTADGHALVLSAHIGDGTAPAVRYPVSRPTTDASAQLMFDIASEMPSTLRAAAAAMGIVMVDGARGCLFEASAAEVMGMLNVGTQGTTANVGGPEA